MSKAAQRLGAGWVAIVIGVAGSVSACTSRGRQYTSSTVDTRRSSPDAGANFTDAAITSDGRSFATDADIAMDADTSTTGEDAATLDVTVVSSTSGERSSESASTSWDAATAETSGDTREQDTSSDGTFAPWDFGVGDPPDYGQFAAGQGKVLVVNTLGEVGAIDVWVAGETEPIAKGLEPLNAARLQLESGAQRVVVTTSGTRAVVGCSEWFPLRPAEQWAAVASRGAHDCGGAGDGSTPTFRQSGVLTGNPVRYVHAGVGDELSVVVSQTREPGTLEPGRNLVGSNLSDCSTGCEIGYELVADDLSISRHFTFQVAVVEDLPPQGEVLLIVLGDVRQDWPAEANALEMLRVDVDGAARVIKRDPETAFAHGGAGSASFSVQAAPSWQEVASANPECAFGAECPLTVLRTPPGPRRMGIESEQYAAIFDVDLEAGHRYVLMSTDQWTGQAYLLEADFNRTDADIAVAAAVNLDPDMLPLTLGVVFGGVARAIDGMDRVPSGEVSDSVAIPAEDGWRLSKAVGDETLASSCFYSATTLPGFRGYFVHSSEQQTIDVRAWPPVIEYSGYMCF